MPEISPIGPIRDSTLVKLVEINYQISTRLSLEYVSFPTSQVRRYLRIRNKFHQEGNQEIGCLFDSAVW